MCEEAREPGDHADHGLGIIDHYHAAGAEHRALLDESLVIHERGFGFFHGLNRNRRASWNHSLELPALWRATAEVVEELPEGKTEHYFVRTGQADVTAYREEFRPCALRIRQRLSLVPLGALHEDVMNGGKRLDVVDRRRLPENSRDCRERWLDPGIAPAALERVHQSGLFTADVSARALVHEHVDALPCSHRVSAEYPGVVGFLDGAFHPQQRLGELSADVDIRSFGADRVRANRASFDECVRSPAHDLAVLERARLGLVGVAAEVMGFPISRLHERPLESGWKSRPSSSRSEEHTSEL